MINSTTQEVLRRVKNSLSLIGYGPTLLRESYKYYDASAYRNDVVRTIPLAAFAQDPPDYRNVCIGVVASNGLSGLSVVAEHQGLCAPLIFEVGARQVTLWKMLASKAPQAIKSIPIAQIENEFDINRFDWSPRRIFEAKTAAEQLDFVDVGLMPIRREQIHGKLDGLLQRALRDIAQAHEEIAKSKIADEELFRFVFRFIAAKVLRDRGEPGEWHADDAVRVLKAIEKHYGAGTKDLPATKIRTREIIETAWNIILNAFHFEHLSVDDLAFIYENTLITPEKRKTYGIHSTPPHIAEYIAQKLPFHLIEPNARRVLEPCSGHGIFLVAAMRRLRDLLAPDVDSKTRHAYFKERLIGLEADSFAREVSRLCLMLADYPNPNGWHISRDDVFATRKLESELSRTDILLCNPPFGKFVEEEKLRYSNRNTTQTKPVEILNRILSHPPSQLGLVLPERFISGAAYRPANRRLGESYENIEIVRLPDRVFTHAEHETVLVMAWHPRTRGASVTVTCRSLDSDEYPAFHDSGKLPPSTTRVKTIPASKKEALSLWVPVNIDIWESLASLPTLSSVADIRRGIQWLPDIDRSKVISQTPCEEWQPGYVTSRDCLSQYFITDPVYINPDPSNMVGNPMEYPWSDPKVLLNAGISGRGRWRLSAITDVAGVLATQAFHIAFPTSNQVAPEIITAILNGPIANAWVSARGEKRHNYGNVCGAIPFPEINEVDQELISAKVAKLEDVMADVRNLLRHENLIADLIQQIDEIIIQAYNLPTKLRRYLLGIFDLPKRPLLVGPKLLRNTDGKTISAIEAEREYTRNVRRYQELGDLLFTKQIDDKEVKEMARLERLLNTYEASFYKSFTHNG